MGSRRNTGGTTLKRECRIPFRFHPNGTGTPTPVENTAAYGYGSNQIKTVEYQSAGVYKVTLYDRHERCVSYSANYHTATAQAVNTRADIYGITTGATSENIFYVVTYVAGSLNSADYSATTWVCGELVFEEIN